MAAARAGCCSSVALWQEILEVMFVKEEKDICEGFNFNTLV